MPGVQVFTRFDVGKETVRGTPVAPTRKLYGECTGVLAPDFGLSFHEGENSGRRIRARRATSLSEDVALKFKTKADGGIGYDDLVVPFSQLKGGASGVGGGADKVWTFTPSLTAANNPESYSVDVGDDVQAWRVQYGMMSRWKLSSALGQATMLEADWFGQRAVKSAPAAPAGNSAVKIPGDLWKIRFATTFAGLGAASDVLAFLVGWDLEVFTGLVWEHYMDGNPFGSQHVETDIAGKLTLTVASTALAVSEIYDKAVAATMDFVQLKATGPVLGGSTYVAGFQTPILWEEPSIIDSDRKGVNLYKVVAHIADDGTNGIVPLLTNSLAALP